MECIYILFFIFSGFYIKATEAKNVFIIKHYKWWKCLHCIEPNYYWIGLKFVIYFFGIIFSYNVFIFWKLIAYVKGNELVEISYVNGYNYNILLEYLWENVIEYPSFSFPFVVSIIMIFVLQIHTYSFFVLTENKIKTGIVRRGKASKNEHDISHLWTESINLMLKV